MEDRKKSKKTSSVWKYCDILDDAYALCTICHHKLSYKSSVTNLRKHFAKKHPQVDMPPHEHHLRNAISEIGREGSDEEERNEIRRGTNSVIVDYLRPAGDESRPKYNSSRNSVNISKYNYSNSSLKREHSPDRHSFSRNSKYNKKEAEETEFELFGRSIVMQMKQLPLVHALELQAEITNLIIQKRIQSLRHTHETNTEEAPMQYALVYATNTSSQENCEEITAIPATTKDSSPIEGTVIASCTSDIQQEEPS